MRPGVPGRVVSVEGLEATVDFWGVRKQVRLHVLDVPVAPGDRVLNRAGHANRRVPTTARQASGSPHRRLARRAATRPAP